MAGGPGVILGLGLLAVVSVRLKVWQICIYDLVSLSVPEPFAMHVLTKLFWNFEAFWMLL